MGDIHDADLLLSPVSDVSVCIDLLSAQFPYAAPAPNMPVIILINQIYCLLPDRTAVDRELESLIRSNILRRFRLVSTGSDEYGLVRMSEYMTWVEKLIPDEKQVTNDDTTKKRKVRPNTRHEQAQEEIEEDKRREKIRKRKRRKLEQLQQQIKQESPAKTGPATSTSTSTSTSTCTSTSTSHTADAGYREEGKPSSQPDIISISSDDENEDDESDSGLAPGREDPIDTSKLRPAHVDRIAHIPDQRLALHTFITRFLPHHIDVYVTHEMLIQCIYEPVKEQWEQMISDDIPTYLVRVGLLVARSTAAQSFWINIPGSGPLVRDIMLGRQEILAFIKRKKYKECFIKELNTLRLKRSGRTLDFHLRDMIGGHHLNITPTTAGTLVQLPHK